MKIALCLSGETRSFNSRSKHGPQEFYRKLKMTYPNIDVFGHTWLHCEEPKSDTFEFKQLLIEDQQIIDDWVSEDFINRAFSNRMGWNKQHVLSNMTPAQFVAGSLQRSRYAYGQVFSAYHCFALVPASVYDIVIRYRWDLDCVCNNPNVNFGNIPELDFFKYTVIAAMDKLLQRENIPAFVTTSNLHLYGGSPMSAHIEDTFYMFNRAGHLALGCDSDNRKSTVEDMLRIIFENAYANEKSSAHSLWGNCIFSHRYNNHTLQGMVELPNMFYLHRDHTARSHLHEPVINE